MGRIFSLRFEKLKLRFKRKKATTHVLYILWEKAIRRCGLKIGGFRPGTLTERPRKPPISGAYLKLPTIHCLVFHNFRIKTCQKLPFAI